MLRKALLFLITLFVLLIAALIIFVATFDANLYKKQLSEIVKQQTGRELIIDGDLTLRAFPNFALKIGQAQLQNADGFTPAAFARIDNADISVALLPLLQQNLVVNAIELAGLELHLQRQKDGTSNWQDFQALSSQASDASEQVEAAKPSAEPSKPEPAQQTSSPMLSHLSIASLNLTNANIHWQDDQAGQKWSLEDLNLHTGHVEPGVAVPLKLAGLFKQEGLKANITLDTQLVIAEDRQHLDLSELVLQSTLKGAALEGGKADVNVQGHVTIDMPEQQLSEVRIKDLAVKMNADDGFVSDGSLLAELSGDARFTPEANQLAVRSMKLNAKLSGDLVAGGETSLHASGDSVLNLNNLLLEIANLSANVDYSGGALKEGKLKADLQAKSRINFSDANVYLENVQFNSNLAMSTMPDVPFSQQAKGQIKLNWKEKSGTASFNPLTVNVGKASFSGSSRIEDLLSEPNITGHFKSNEFVLRDLLAQLKVDVPKTSKQGLFGKTQANFRLDANANDFKLSTLRLNMDELAVSGDIGMQGVQSAKPRLNADLQLPKLNLDDYLPAEQKQAKPAALLPIAVMRTTNGVLKLSIGELISNKLRMQQASIVVNADDGVIEAKPIKAQLYQGRYEGEIRLDASTDVPSVSMAHRLNNLRSGELLFDLFDDKMISGKATLSTQLNASGNTTDEIIRQLNGQLDIEFIDGTIRDSNFAKKTEVAIKAFEDIKTDGEGKETVRFTKLQGEWVVKRGIFSTEAMQMLSPHFHLNGRGAVDFPKEVIDFKLRLTEPDSDDPFIPFHIHGPFKQLNYALELDVLLKALANKRLDEEKQKVKERLEKERDKAKEKLEQRVEEKKQELEQQLKDKVGEELGDKLGEELGEELGNQLKDKLKSFF